MIKSFHQDYSHSSKWLPHRDKTQIIDLTIAEMDFGLFQSFEDSLKKYLKSVNISESESELQLAQKAKNAIKNWYNNNYGIINIENEEILFCSSIATLYSCVVEALTDPNDQILVLTPIYSYYMNAGKLLNRKVIGSELLFLQQGTNQYDFFIDFEDFQNKIQNCRMLVLSHPHNPSGRIWNQKQLTKIIQLCKQKNVYIFSDQILGDMAMIKSQNQGKNSRFQSLLKYNYNKIVVGNSLSKSFNSSSIQSGYVIITDLSVRLRIAQILERYNGNVRSTNIITSYYFTACLSQQGKQWLNKINRIFQNNYKQLKKLKSRILPKLILTQCHSGFLTWIDFKHYVIDMKHLKQTLQGKNIHVLFGSGYFIPPKETTQIRICLSVEEVVFNQFLRRLEELFGTMPSL